MKLLGHVAALAVGIALGWWLARSDSAPEPTEPVPERWVARLDAHYITAAMIQEEMRRRGGAQPGQYQTPDQKRALLDSMLLQRALVDAAREAGLHRHPETQRSIEQLLTSQFLQETLRKEQAGLVVSDEDVAAFHAANAQEFTVPARRRIAMIRIAVADGASPASWKSAEQRAADALGKARALAPEVPDFGVVAREYSEDASSRYRGGSIGWLTEGRAAAYRHDPDFLAAAYALTEPGSFSAPVRGKDGVYLARLVELQPAQARSLEQLQAGIRQRLLQQRYDAQEQAFRRRVLSEAAPDIDVAALDAVAPVGPPAQDSTPTPPAMPGAEEADQ